MKVGFAHYGVPVISHPCAKVSLQPRISCPFPGTHPEILGNILDKAVIPYHVVNLQPNNTQLVDFGVYNSSFGQWTGLIGEVLRGTVDTLVFEYFITEERLEHMAFSFPVTYSGYVFGIKETQNSVADSALLVFSTFSVQVWLALIFSLLAVFFGAKLWSNAAEAEDLTWISFRVFICQSVTHERFWKETFTGSILLFCLSFLSALFLSLYEGSLLLQHFKSTDKPPFEDVFQLIAAIKRGRLTPLLKNPTGSFQRHVETSESKIFRQLRAGLKYNPPMIEPNMTKMMDLLESGRYTLAADFGTLMGFKSLTPWLKEIGHPDLNMGYLAFIFRKNFSLLPRIDESIISSETMPQFIFEKYKRAQIQSTTASVIKDGQRVPLNLTNLVGLFMLLSVGIGAALLTVLFESICRRKLNQEISYSSEIKSTS